MYEIILPPYIQTPCVAIGCCHCDAASE